MFKQPISLLLIAISMLLTACNDPDGSQLETTVDNFSKYYFNWQYAKCLPLVTPESHRFLKFKATNVTDDDIQLLRSMQEGASVEREDELFADNDSAVNVKLRLHNVAYADTIGRKARIYEDAEAELLLVRKGSLDDDKGKGKWRVVVSNEWPKMAVRRQSEEQDRGQSQD